MTRARRRRIIRTRRTMTGLALVGSISFLAGMTDATGLLLTGDFVSFMTGNTTRAAMRQASSSPMSRNAAFSWCLAASA